MYDPHAKLDTSKEKEIQMETIACVFSVTDNGTAVFWGAFPTMPDAHSAVDNYIASHTFWTHDDFKIEELPFGVLV
jgi:hypothetical protein